MKRYIVGTCGYYDDKNTIPNGQTIRSKNVTKALIERLGYGNVSTLCYYNWKKKPFILLYSFIKLMFQSKNIILFPDQNAYKALIPIAVITSFFSRTKVFYNVIGGWLPSDIRENSIFIPFLKRLDGIFVQTNVLKNNLNSLGLKNVFIFPNFKFFKSPSMQVSERMDLLPIRICFLSRVEAQKGVTEMINAINELNADKDRFILDIYGGINNRYKTEFFNLLENSHKNIKYLGPVLQEDVITVMKNYSLHLFPTKYYTEGFPGSIYDAMSAGIPTLAAGWESAEDIINNKIDGLVFPFGDYNNMKEILLSVYDNPSQIHLMKQNCLKRIEELKPEKIIEIMIKKISL